MRQTRTKGELQTRANTEKRRKTKREGNEADEIAKMRGKVAEQRRGRAESERAECPTELRACGRACKNLENQNELKIAESKRARRPKPRSRAEREPTREEDPAAESPRTKRDEILNE